jgi:hypothetical protein
MKHNIMGYVLGQAGVPCAEQIAAMLSKGSAAPEVPVVSEVYDLSSLGGKYTYYRERQNQNNSDIAVSYKEFAVGKFPLTLSCRTDFDDGAAASLVEAPVNIYFTEFPQPIAAGQRISLCCRLPAIASKWWNLTDAIGVSRVHEAMTMDCTLRSRDASGNMTGYAWAGYDTEYDVLADMNGSTPVLGFGGYAPLFSELKKEEQRDDTGKLTGFTLSGVLLAPLHEIEWKFVAEKDRKQASYLNSSITLTYASSGDLMLTIYE